MPLFYYDFKSHPQQLAAYRLVFFIINLQRTEHIFPTRFLSSRWQERQPKYAMHHNISYHYANKVTTEFVTN
jgi:hypothetical protein